MIGVGKDSDVGIVIREKIVCEHAGNLFGPAEVVFHKYDKCPLCEAEQRIEELVLQITEDGDQVDRLETRISDLEVENAELREELQSLKVRVGWRREGF